jgi:hypothetical protein
MALAAAHGIAALTAPPFTAHNPVPDNVTTASITAGALVEGHPSTALGIRPVYSTIIDGTQHMTAVQSQLSDSTAISSIPTARESYDLLVRTYRGHTLTPETKDRLVVSFNKIFTDHFNVANNPSSDAGAVANAYRNIFELKKLLDVQLATAVKCSYRFMGATPVNYGCDLRELIYNRDGTKTQNGQLLLELFQKIAGRYLLHNEGNKEIHALSDIDDTCYANPLGGFAVAGIDRSWLPHKLYPGIKELHRQLISLPNSSRYATIVSATPGAAKPSKLTHDELINIFGENNFAFIQGEESKSGILRKIPSIITTVVNGGDNPNGAFYEGIGDIKLRRIIEYASIFPERNFIWFGDNGQADEWVGSELLKLDPRRYTVCIHIVKKPASPTEGIIYFRSYSELARKLRDIGIFSDANVVAVKKSADEDCRHSEANKVTEDQWKTHCTSKQTKGGRKTRRYTGGSTTSRITRKTHKGRRTLKSPIRNNKKYTIRRRRGRGQGQRRS